MIAEPGEVEASAEGNYDRYAGRSY